MSFLVCLEAALSDTNGIGIRNHRSENYHTRFVRRASAFFSSAVVDQGSLSVRQTSMTGIKNRHPETCGSPGLRRDP